MDAVLKVTVHKNKTVTLRGINVGDFDYIIVAASNRHHEIDKEINSRKPTNKVQEENILAEQEWSCHILDIISEIKRQMKV